MLQYQKPRLQVIFLNSNSKINNLINLKRKFEIIKLKYGRKISKIKKIK